MTDRVQEAIDRFERMKAQLKEGDPNLWRHALAEATVDLLATGETVTVARLIERLRQGFGPDDPILRPASCEQAIENLRAIEEGKAGG